MTGVIAHYAMFGKLPPVDNEGRPKQFFGNRLHDTCYRRPFFDAGLLLKISMIKVLKQVGAYIN